MSKYQQEAWLRERYHDDGLLLEEMADECGVSKSTISYWMEKFEIERRDVGGRVPKTPWGDDEDLRELYHEERLTTHDIADKFDICQHAVSSALRRADIETRQPGEMVGEIYHHADEFREVLAPLDTQREAREAVGCSEPTLRKWMREHFGHTNVSMVGEEEIIDDEPKHLYR